MEQRSVFFEEWIRSLREQYKHVVAQDDRVTLSSLTEVMSNVGFSEAELAQLRVEATMHVDQVGSDHVADMEILEQTLPHATECLCPVCATTDETRSVSEDQPVPIDQQQEAIEAPSVFPGAAPEKAEARESNDEADPLTFEDSLAAQESDASDSEDPDEASDEAEDDDNPQQMSLL